MGLDWGLPFVSLGSLTFKPATPDTLMNHVYFEVIELKLVQQLCQDWQVHLLLTQKSRFGLFCTKELHWNFFHLHFFFKEKI